MNAKQTGIIINFLEKGYKSMSEMQEKSEASTGSIHQFCKSLVAAKIAKYDESTKKYSLEIDEKQEKLILEYFIEGPLSIQGVISKLKSQEKELTGSVRRMLSGKSGDVLIGKFLEIYQSRGLLHSAINQANLIEGDTKDPKIFNLTRMGYQLEDACYVCKKKFNSLEDTLVSQNVVEISSEQVEYAPDEYDIYDIEQHVDSFLVHSKCLFDLEKTFPHKSSESKCNYCGFPLSPTYFSENLKKERKYPPKKFRRLIAENSSDEIQEGFNIMFQSHSADRFEEEFGIKIGQDALEQISWDKRKIVFQIGKETRKEILANLPNSERGMPRWSSWVENLRTHDYKANGEFVTEYLIPDRAISREIGGIPDSNLTVESVVQALNELEFYIPKDHPLKMKCGRWHEDAHEIFEKCQDVLGINAQGEESASEFFGSEVDKVFKNLSHFYERTQNDEYETKDFSLIHRDEKGNSYHRECYAEALEIRQAKLNVEIAEQTLKNLKEGAKKN